jgi:uncharacterized protein (DUF1800 family)
MAAFWANHFTVSAKRFFVAPVVGAFEREAIRPHLFGRFADMLAASTMHPAMLLYLDNVGSVGPNSRGGRWARRGLNENLARELLELHTLGVGGGYDQADVGAMARLLTGWTVGGIGRRMPITGAFRFIPAIHEPGPKKLLGTVYGQGGVTEGRRALEALAAHPATARHLATKLVRHFVADDPPPAAIARIAKVFAATDGDLRAVTLALIDLPEAWREPLPKVKSHYDFVVSLARALALDDPPERGIRGAFYTMGQVPFTAPSPAGWPDTADAWLSPESLMRRLELARRIARLAGRAADPELLFDATIAPVARPATRREILAAPSARDGIALTLASAEFQRR